MTRASTSSPVSAAARTLARALALALVCAALVAPARDAAAAPSTRGSALQFWGWSKDSRLIAYTRSRVGRTRPDQRMHRFVEAGQFAGFGKVVGGDVAAYARAHAYVAVPAARRRPSETRFEFAASGSDTAALALVLEVGRAQRWRFMRGDAVLAEHTFDRIYVGFDVELYPSPDATQAVLVMHLDTGWEIDAAIFPVPLSSPVE